MSNASSGSYQGPSTSGSSDPYASSAQSQWQQYSLHASQQPTPYDAAAASAASYATTPPDLAAQSAYAATYGYGSTYGYGYAYGYPQQHAYAPTRSPKTTLGLWALILGLSGFLLPIGLNAVAAIVLGIVGIVKEQRRGMSIAGLSIGAFVLFVWMPLMQIVWSIVLSIMFSV